MKTLKLQKVGNSYGFTLPKELVDKYNLEDGIELLLIEKKGGFTITSFDLEFEEWANAFEKTDKKYKNTLNALSE